MDRGAWWTTVHGVVESDMTEQITQFAAEPSTEFISVVIVFFSSVFCLVLSNFFCVCWNSHFVYKLFSWPQWTFLLPSFCTLYKEKQLCSFYFIKVCFWSFIVFFCLEYNLLFFIFLCFLCWFLHIDLTGNIPIPNGVVLCRRWNLLFNNALALVFLSNLFDCPSSPFCFQWLPLVLRLC